jgi:hypothetical protein
VDCRDFEEIGKAALIDDPNELGSDPPKPVDCQP